MTGHRHRTKSSKTYCWTGCVAEEEDARRMRRDARMVRLVFGCSDPDLGYEEWQEVISRLAEHLASTAGTDLYGGDWDVADEGCQIVAGKRRIAEIRDALAEFPGPISVYEEVP